MTLRHLKIFVSVYQNMSITRASEELHLVQPSVSLAIKELENYYGIKLFDRLSRRIYPTDTGARFYDYALHIISMFDEMEREIKNWDTIGSLRIGSNIPAGPFLLPTIIKEFNNVCPDIKTTVTIENNEEIQHQLIDNKVDIAMIEGNVLYPQIISEPLMDSRICFVAVPTNPLVKKKNVSLEEIASCSLLMREAGSAGREKAESVFLSNNISIKPIWESASSEALLRAAFNNLGIAVLPYIMAKEEILSGRLSEITVDSMNLSGRFSIIFCKNKYLSKSAKTFIELCKKHCGQ